MSVRSYSPSLSMSTPGTPTTTHRRRLSSSSRRGSTSAPDPWALATFDAPASSTSRLHIVRLPPPTKEELEKYEKEHGTLSRRGSWGSSGLSKSLSMTPASGERVSFAGHAARSPSIDQPMRPRIHPSSQTGALAPQQLYDLAMSSIHPRDTTDQVGSKAGEPVTSPTPAAFTALPPNHYLPFIVRSSEVQQLLSQGPPRRLWALIKQIYPTKLTEESEDPTKWPFWQLERWMFKVDRYDASDRVWVHKARMCISRRSEPLWEKIKNALGVPPELEISDDEDSDDEDLDAVVGSIAGLDVTPKSPLTQTSRPVGIPKDEVNTTAAEEGNDMEEDFIDIGPTGLVMEAIYPSAVPESPPQSQSSPPKRDGGMEIIGEEEEDDEKTAASRPKVETVSGVTSTAESEGMAEAKGTNPADLDTSRMVGLTFISHSK